MLSVWNLVIGYIKHRPLSATLSIGLLAIGVAMLSLLFLLDRHLTQQFDKNIAGIDLIIGAKGSPLQLVTSSLYHADAPTGNIPIKAVKAFGNPKHPLIDRAIPLGLGDNYRGYRIVGTTPDFLDLYQAEIKQGTNFNRNNEVIVGSEVASKLNLHIGSSFFSTHGFDQNPDLAHQHGKLVVAGILKPTGLVIDNLIVTSMSTIWSVHDHGTHEDEHEEHDHSTHEHHEDEHEEHDHSAHEHHEDEHKDHNHNSHETEESEIKWYENTDKEITCLLTIFKGTNAKTLNFARSINANTNLLAASPAIVMAQFSEQISSLEKVLKMIGWIIVILSMFSLIIILLNALQDRQSDLSLLRAIGAKPSMIFKLTITEAFILAVTGTLLGLLIGRVSLFLIGSYVANDYPIGQFDFSFLQSELYVGLGCILASVFAALFPAIKAYNVDPGLK